MMVAPQTAEIGMPPLVAHVIYRLDIGGLENGLVNLVNAMPASRYRHAIICLAGYSNFAERIRRADVRLYDLEKRPGKDVACYRRLYRLLRRLRPDVLHTRNLGTIDCQFVAAAAGVPFRVHGEHGWEVSDIDGTRSKTVLLRRASRAVIHRYVTVSAHMAAWLNDVVGIPRKNVVQIYNGIDSQKFCPVSGRGQKRAPSGRLVVGTVGRLDPVKDHMTLLRSMALLQRQRPGSMDWQLVIVGDGGMRDRLEQYVGDAGLASTVRFVGASDDVASELRRFDVFALSSLNEGISNTILEAMATELPVVATAVGGNPELVVDGSTGFLVESQNAEALAEALARYAERPKLIREHGCAARERVVRKFGLGRMAAEYASVYDEGTVLDEKLSSGVR